MDESGETKGILPQTPQVAVRDELGRLLPGARIAVGHGRPFSDKGLMAQLKARNTPKNARKVAEAVWRRAMQGESWAVEYLSNRIYGRVPQVTRIAGLQDGEGNERPIPLLLLPAMPFGLGEEPQNDGAIIEGEATELPSGEP